MIGSDQAEVSEEIQTASVRARLGVAAFALALLIAMVFAQQFLRPIEDGFGSEPEHALERVRLVILGIAALGVPILVAGVFAVVNGARAVATERFPPVGMPVIADTPIRTGARARRSGRLLQFVGLLICLVATGFPLALWLLVQRLSAGM